MGELVVRDVTRAGRELGRQLVTDLPSTVTLGALLELRIRTEVSTYNASPGPVFVGLVQPSDSIRYSDGYRMRHPRVLDPDVAVLAAREAVAAGMLGLDVGGERVTDLEAGVTVDDHDEILVVLERPVVVDGF